MNKTEWYINFWSNIILSFLTKGVYQEWFIGFAVVSLIFYYLTPRYK
jgi:hypothetical protein